MKKALLFVFINLCFGISLFAQPEPVFNVKDYGATGDGVTNDAVAIQAAIDACTGTNGSVLIPEGIFKTSMLELKSDMTLSR